LQTIASAISSYGLTGEQLNDHPKIGQPYSFRTY